MAKYFRLLVAVFVLFGLPVLAVRAQSEVVLTVDGAIASSTPLNFSIEDLEALGIERVETVTPWHDGKNVFEGVSLAGLMAHVGAKGDTALVVALNNYVAEVPLSDFSLHPVILAYKLNGEFMSVADKGPLFIIYPFSDFPELQNEQSYARSAWQVRSITIE